MNETQHGYLLLADISGYTSFVAGTELEHSQDILSELLEVIIIHLKPQLVIHKIEGDAVFAYAAENKIPRGESLFDKGVPCLQRSGPSPKAESTV